MARVIEFSSKEMSFTAGIVKVDRKKVYGYSEVKVTDKEDKSCSLVALSDDGSYILPSGSTGLTKFDSEQRYIENSGLKAVDLEGNPAEKVPSVFDKEVSLEKVDSLTAYLDINVKSIYQLSFDDEGEQKSLVKQLLKNLYSFVFNYRADYEGDDAFLISDGKEVYAVVGKKCEFEYLGLQEIVVDGDDSEEEEDFDFGML